MSLGDLGVGSQIKQVWSDVAERSALVQDKCKEWCWNIGRRNVVLPVPKSDWKFFVKYVDEHKKREAEIKPMTDDQMMAAAKWTDEEPYCAMERHWWGFLNRNDPRNSANCEYVTTMGRTTTIS